jgi:hypothetical protein
MIQAMSSKSQGISGICLILQDIMVRTISEHINRPELSELFSGRVDVSQDVRAVKNLERVI